ncbi:MAG: heat shock protein Hsp20 [Bradyrhizobium sp.]|nr:heat shock protein Hsp20 [Bradyrhizobium sp.]
MRLTSLVPFSDGGALPRPDFGLFGLHREIDRLFGEFAQSVGPSAKIIPNIDISETNKAIEISAEMPGLERQDVGISIDDDTLSPSAARRRSRKAGKTRTFSSANAATGYSCVCCNCLPALIHRALRPPYRTAF